MSRKVIFVIAAAAVAAATFAAGTANAMSPLRGDRDHPHGLVPPVHHIGYPHWHDHVHLWHRHVYVRPVVYGSVVEPGPCTCLWKGYTPDGTVVFKDLCTQEMASAPAVDGDAAAVTEAPDASNFAGKTYKDYLAANPQNAPQATSPAPAQPAPQKN